MFESSGEIETFGVSVWESSNLSNSVTSVNWGVLAPSEKKTMSYVIRNDSNFGTTLNLATKNWNPENASNFIFLSWNLENVSFRIGEISEVQLTLKVSPKIQNIFAFTFDIFISTNN